MTKNVCRFITIVSVLFFNASSLELFKMLKLQIQDLCHIETQLSKQNVKCYIRDNFPIGQIKFYNRKTTKYPSMTQIFQTGYIRSPQRVFTMSLVCEERVTPTQSKESYLSPYSNWTYLYIPYRATALFYRRNHRNFETRFALPFFPKFVILFYFILFSINFNYFRI